MKIPYKGGDLALSIILPYDRNETKAVEEQLTDEWFLNMNNDVRPAFKIDLRLQRFAIQTPATLTDHLKESGLTEVFSNGGDLSGLSDESPLKADSVVHEAFIKVRSSFLPALSFAKDILIVLGERKRD